MLSIWKKSKVCKRILLKCLAMHMKKKQIATARLNAKLYARDNQISAFQEYRDKYRQMMNDRQIPQQPSESAIPLVLPNSQIPPVGLHPAGIREQTDANDRRIPLTPTFPQVIVARQREEEDGEVLPEDPTPTFKSRQEGFRIESQTPRNLKLVNITLPALPSPPGFSPMAIVG